MEYKIGDEVLVKARIIGSRNGVSRLLVQSQQDKFFVEKDNVMPVPDMTAEEAWEIAKNLFADYSNIELDEIFGKGWSFPKLMELTPQEAKAKIEAWEAEKEIKVGDEVAPKSDPNNNECKFVVTIKDDEDGIISGFSVFGGNVFSERDIERYQKTGRHIDIDVVLKQIWEDD